jgi:glutathione peroxidase-family protein
MAIFDETYRVVAVESQRLTIQGMLSGKIMTIVNTAPNCPLTQKDYPLGQLIALTDPSIALQN